MLEGNNTVEKVYRRLYSEYRNHHGVSTLMGVMYNYSGIDPTCVQEVLKKKLKSAGSPYCTDRSYTEAVDSGLIDREEFIHPFQHHQFGYGLMQWSSSSEKSDLYDIAKSKNVSIGDLETQIDMVIEDINRNYPLLRDGLKRARGVTTPLELMLEHYDDKLYHDDKTKQALIKQSSTYYRMFSQSVYIGEPTQVKGAVRAVKGATEPVKTIVSDFNLNDKVIVNGKIYGNGHGTGTAIEKKNAMMYVVGFARPDRYPYYIGLAAVKGGMRQGWAAPDVLSKAGTVAAVKPTKEIVAKEAPKSGLSSLAGDYATTYKIYIRNDAGTQSSPLVSIPEGHVVSCTKGQFTSFKGSKWLYVETIYKNVKYTGFCSIEYLAKM